MDFNRKTFKNMVLDEIEMEKCWFTVYSEYLSIKSVDKSFWEIF